MFNEINEALQLCRKEVIELTLLDTLWVTTQKGFYREEYACLLRYLSERISRYLAMEGSVDEIEFIVGEIIEDKTAAINNEYLDIEF